MRALPEPYVELYPLNVRRAIAIAAAILAWLPILAAGGAL